MVEVVVTTGAIRRAKLQSDCNYQHINTQLYTGRMPFLSNSVRAWRNVPKLGSRFCIHILLIPFWYFYLASVKPMLNQPVCPVHALGGNGPWSHMGSRIESIDPIHFLAGCHKGWLNRAPSVLGFILVFLSVWWDCLDCVALFCIFSACSVY